MDYYATWFGVGVKGGGSIGIGGFETMEGYISNLGMPSHTHSINISYLRMGAGLGAGAGLCAIYVFNCRNPQNLHQKTDATWSVNVSLGGKWSDVVKFLSKSKLFSIAPKLVSGISKASAYDLDSLRNIASNLMTMYEVTEYSKDKVVTIDIPLAGVGLELSAQKLYGTIFIGDLQMQEQNLNRSGLPSGGRRIGEL
jgi:hypothetical protein